MAADGVATARTKVLALVALSGVQVFAGVVLKLANAGGEYAFSPQSSLVMSEAVKLGLSASYLRREHESGAAARGALVRETSPALVLHMGCLAGIYAWNNALAFWLFARADPGSIMLTKSTSAIVSAVMLYFVRGFVLSRQRWLVLLVQVLGLVTAQYDACTGTSVYGARIYMTMLLTLFNSNVANVWNEYVIKNFDGAGLATKNIYLYGFGAALNLGVFAYNSATVGGYPGFFQGYGPAAMAVVTSNALIGITMNVVYRYADALVKTIASSMTSVVLLLLSVAFFGVAPKLMMFVGTAVLVSSTYLYFAMGVLEARVADLDPAANGPAAKDHVAKDHAARDHPPKDRPAAAPAK